MKQKETDMLKRAIDTHINQLYRNAEAYKNNDNTLAQLECLGEIKKYVELKKQSKMKHYRIYQADTNTPEGLAILFQKYNRIMETGKKLTMSCYKMVYEGDIKENKDSKMPITEQIYMKFNMSRPKDFKGHSLSISDIIVIDDKQYFCDSFSFREISIPEKEEENQKTLHDAVCKILKDGKLSGEVETHPNGEISILIEWGDWKHDHGYLRYLMQQNGFTEVKEAVTEEDGSDCYSAIHIFKK